MTGNRVRTTLAALSLAAAGVFFLLYPAIRPFSDETSLSGARAFASNSWVVAHSLAMLGFVLLTLGLFGLYTRLRETAAAGLAGPALLVTWVGVGLTLPYYGAETFGLHVVGEEALRQHSAALVSMANSIRFEAGVWFFLAGLLGIAAGTILFAVGVWRSGQLPRWSGIPLAVGFALFLPQFFTPQPVRVAHGLLITLGCLSLAWALQVRS